MRRSLGQLFKDRITKTLPKTRDTENTRFARPNARDKEHLPTRMLHDAGAFAGNIPDGAIKQIVNSGHDENGVS